MTFIPKGNRAIAFLPFLHEIAYNSYDFRTFLVLGGNKARGDYQNRLKSLDFPMTFAPSRQTQHKFLDFCIGIAYISYDFRSGEPIAGRIPGTFLLKSLIFCMVNAKTRESSFSLNIAYILYDFCNSGAPWEQQSPGKSLGRPEIAWDAKSQAIA